MGWIKLTQIEIVYLCIVTEASTWMNWFINMKCLGFFSYLYTNNRMKDSLHVLGYIWQIAAHDDDVNAVAFADDSSHILFSGGDDGLCRVRTEWDQKSVSMGNSVKPYLV